MKFTIKYLAVVTPVASVVTALKLVLNVKVNELAPDVRMMSVIGCPGNILVTLILDVAVGVSVNKLLSDASIAVGAAAVKAVAVDPDNAVPTMRSLIVVKAVFVVGGKAVLAMISPYVIAAVRELSNTVVPFEMNRTTKYFVSVQVSVPVDLNPVEKVRTGLPASAPSTISVITCPGNELVTVIEDVAEQLNVNRLFSDASSTGEPAARAITVAVEPESTLPTIVSLTVVTAVFVVGGNAVAI
jgi:hypothetical protein